MFMVGALRLVKIVIKKTWSKKLTSELKMVIRDWVVWS